MLCGATGQQAPLLVLTRANGRFPGMRMLLTLIRPRSGLPWHVLARPYTPLLMVGSRTQSLSRVQLRVWSILARVMCCVWQFGEWTLSLVTRPVMLPTFPLLPRFPPRIVLTLALALSPTTLVRLSSYEST